jgi:hypothetical protein
VLATTIIKMDDVSTAYGALASVANLKAAVTTLDSEGAALKSGALASRVNLRLTKANFDDDLARAFAATRAQCASVKVRWVSTSTARPCSVVQHPTVRVASCAGHRPHLSLPF